MKKEALGKGKLHARETESPCTSMRMKAAQTSIHAEFQKVFLFKIIDTKRNEEMRRRRREKYNFMNVTIFLMMVFIKKEKKNDLKTSQRRKKGKRKEGIRCIRMKIVL